jgi:uncharacterized protein (TIGR02246 family)
MSPLLYRGNGETIDMNSNFLLGGIGVVCVAASSAALAAPAPAPARAHAAIQAVLDTSSAAWSAGDLDRFMTCYEDAPTTSYVSGTRFVQGYRAIRDMYAQRFGGGSKASMGRLTLEIVDLRLLADHRRSQLIATRCRRFPPPKPLRAPRRSAPRSVIAAAGWA